MADEFDYVVVGGGSAGALLAARLSEQADATVCLLEAGEKDSNILFHIPAGFIKVIFKPDYTWSFETQPGPYIDDRKVPVIQGRVLGGSGSINGMVYTRGQREDYDHWAELGNTGWSYANVLPYFRSCEQRIGPGDDAYRGRSGGLTVVDLNWPSMLNDAFLSACEKNGIPLSPDYNGAAQEGAGRYQYNIDRGWRMSAARAFLKPAMNRANLDVRTGTLATSIRLDGTKAAGVRCRHVKSGKVADVRARREVILTCGAINTPKLLQLSGIGPGAVLKAAGVDVAADIPGIGTNYQDHYTPRLTYLATDVPTVNGVAHGRQLAMQVLNWLVGRPSILGIGVVLGFAFWKTRPELNRPNIVVTFTPGSFKAGFLGRLDDVPGMTCGVWQLRPDSRGSVAIASADPDDKPLIQPNFLQDERDQTTVVEALKIARKIMATPEIGRYCKEESMPGPAIATDDDLLAYARRQGLCGYHACGTAKMGPDSDTMAVVDDQLRVRRVQGLRIADASIMPTLVSGNTNAATMMIAAKAADLALGRAS